MEATRANVTKVLKRARLSQHKNDSPKAYSDTGFTSEDFGSRILVEWWTRPEWPIRSHRAGHIERKARWLEIDMQRMLSALQSAGLNAVRNPDKANQIIIHKAVA